MKILSERTRRKTSKKHYFLMIETQLLVIFKLIKIYGFVSNTSFSNLINCYIASSPRCKPYKDKKRNHFCYLFHVANNDSSVVRVTEVLFVNSVS